MFKFYKEIVCLSYICALCKPLEAHNFICVLFFCISLKMFTSAKIWKFSYIICSARAQQQLTLHKPQLHKNQGKINIKLPWSYVIAVKKVLLPDKEANSAVIANSMKNKNFNLMFKKGFMTPYLFSKSFSNILHLYII